MSAPAASQDGGSARGFVSDAYYVKTVRWQEETVPVLTQNENGPCPLLAICNVLFLLGRLKLSAEAELVTYEHLIELLGDLLMKAAPGEGASKEAVANFEQNVGDALAVLPKLQTGLDVNVRFTEVDQLEYTQDLLIFDLLRLPLYHGWLVDPADQDTAVAVGTLSYNHLVEKIVAYKEAELTGDGEKNDVIQQGMAVENFLNHSASQLTEHGIKKLKEKMQHGDLAVFFRNNHFMTLTKHADQLYTLATDQGYLHQPVAWETLAGVDGTGDLVDGNFAVYVAPAETVIAASPTVEISEGVDDEQLNDPDFLLALSLHHEETGSAAGAYSASEESDRMLALELQREEEEQHTREQRAVQERRDSERRLAEQRRQQQSDDGGSCTIS